MKAPCEIIVTRIIPHVRALVSIELKENYQLSGRYIAKLVGTTEAAVSQYIHGLRGVNKDFLADFPEITPFAKEVSKELYQKRGSDFELMMKMGDMCATLRDNKKFIELYSEGKEGIACNICFKSPD